MIQHLNAARAVTASLAIGGATLNTTFASAVDGGVNPEPPTFKAPKLVVADLTKEPVPCPVDRELLTEKDPKGFSPTERARINSAVHILETVMPEAEWLARARQIEWTPLVADSAKFAEIIKIPGVMNSPVTYAKRREPVFFNFNGEKFEDKEYLLVPSPAKREFSAAEMAVSLATQIASKPQSRDVVSSLASSAKMYKVQAEVGKRIFDAIGDKLILDEQTSAAWKRDLDRLCLEGAWLSLHVNTNRDLVDCCMSLKRISDNEALLKENPELAKKIAALQERVRAWPKVQPATLKNADELYEMFNIIDWIQRRDEVKALPVHTELFEKATKLANSIDDYNMFLIQIDSLREQARTEKAQKEKAQKEKIEPIAK